MRLWVGPFVWSERISSKTGKPAPAGVFGWRMPPGATQALDFRGAAGTPTLDARSPAKAIFVTPDEIALAAPYVQIASDPLETLTGRNKNLLQDIFEAPATAGRFVDILHELATGHADLTRALKAPPRIASRGGRIRWLIGGQVVKSIEIGPGAAEWPGTVARHQEVYRVLAQSGVKDLESKYLATLAAKYKLREAEAVDNFIPPDLPRKAPVKPSTTLTENFLGTSITLGGDQTWTEVSGTWGNSAGKGTYTADANTRYARCESTLSTDDMRVQVQIEASSAQNAYRGPMGRFAAAATTGYTAISRPEINDYYAQYLNAGATTDIVTSELSGSITLPSLSAIVINGDEIEIFEGANSRGSTIHSSVTGNVRGGLGAYGESLTVGFDDWQAEDLGAGAAYSLTAAQGAYVLIGQAANLKYGRRLVAAQGSYMLAGQAADLRLASDLILAAATGSYALTGQAAALKLSRALVAGAGNYTLAGQMAALKLARALAAAGGSYTLTGQAAAFFIDRLIDAGYGAYVLTGKPVVFTWSGAVTVNFIVSVAGALVRVVTIEGELGRTLSLEGELVRMISVEGEI